ncbi:MAG: hypothetical protein WC860_05865 [Candidatus Margulisiibacteriota bacterium]|jgi:hypothetical protein
MKWLINRDKSLNEETEEEQSLFFINKISGFFSTLNISKNKRINQVLAKLFLQGIKNNKYIFLKPNSIWPSWIYNYLRAGKNLEINNCKFLLNNNFEKNYVISGFPFENEKLIIDQKGLITCASLNWSLDSWLYLNNKMISSSQIEKVVQKKIRNLPVIETQFCVDNILVTSEVFFKANLDKINHQENLFYNKVCLENLNNESKQFSFFFAIKPYNPEGLTDIKEITFLSNNSFIVDNRLALILDKKPDNVVCLNFDDDTIPNLLNLEMILKVNCNKNLASAYAEYRINLAAGEKCEFTAKLSNEGISRLSKVNKKKAVQVENLNFKIDFISNLSYESEKANVLIQWQQIKETLTELKFAETKIAQTYEKQKLHLFDFITKKEVLSGGLTGKFFCIRDTVNIIRALNRIGATYFSEEILNNIIQHKIFPYLHEELDSLGQLIYMIYDTYEYTNDKNFLEKNFYFINQIVQKIENHTIKEVRHGYKGLMDKSFSFDYFGEKDYYLWDNFWVVKGLQLAQKSAEVLNFKDKAVSLDLLYKTKLNTLNRLIEDLCLKNKFTSIILPITPSRFQDYGLIYSLISVYPLNIYSIKDEIIVNSINDLKEQFLIDDKIFNQKLKGFSSLENAILANLYLLNNDQKCFEILNWLTNITSNVGSLAEFISKDNCAFGEADYAASISEYLTLIHNLFVQEEDNTLKLLPFIPENWIDSNNLPLIEVKNIFTKFGKLSFVVERKDQIIQVNLDTSFHTQPSEIIFNLPKTIKKIIIDSIERNVYNTYVRIPHRCTSFLLEI